MEPVLEACDLVCLDLDGCLVDSTVAIPRCINLALQALHLPARSEPTLRRFIGPPLVESFRQLLDESGLDPERAWEAVEVYREHYPTVSLESTRVIPGVREMLARLAPSAILAVVTSKPRALAVPVLDHVVLSSHFVAVHGPDLASEEPKAATLKRAIDQLGTSADACVMVGDRRHDVEAGRSCGTWTVGVTWGSGSREELEAARPDVILDEPMALADRLTTRARKAHA